MYTLTGTKLQAAYLESDHDRSHQIEFPGSGNDSLSDDIAPHDSTENVDHEGIHLNTLTWSCFWDSCATNLGISCDDFESFFDLISSGTATNIKDLEGSFEVPSGYGGCPRPRWACLPSSCQAKSQLYCGPNGPTDSIFYRIRVKQSSAIVFIFNLDKVLLKKLYPTMNI